MLGSVSERLDIFCNFQEPTAMPSRKKGGRCARGWCVRRGSLLQDRLPVKFNTLDATRHLSGVRMCIPHTPRAT